MQVALYLAKHRLMNTTEVEIMGSMINCAPMKAQEMC